jgi:hypothetical protein
VTSVRILASLYFKTQRCQASSHGVVIRLRIGRRGIKVQFPAGVRDFSLLLSVKISSSAHPVSSPQSVKLAAHLPLMSLGINGAVSVPPPPTRPVCLHYVDSDNFTFTGRAMAIVSVAGLSPRRHRFSPRSVHIRFVTKIVTLYKFFSDYFYFLFSVLFHQPSRFMH